MAEVKDVTEKVELESKMYQLIEMKDEMSSALDNADTVHKQQEKLIEVLKRDKETEGDFGNFITELEKSLKDLQKQKEQLVEKHNYLQAIIDVYENKSTDTDKIVSKQIETVVTYVLLALGM